MGILLHLILDSSGARNKTHQLTIEFIDSCEYCSLPLIESWNLKDLKRDREESKRDGKRDMKSGMVNNFLLSVLKLSVLGKT